MQIKDKEYSGIDIHLENNNNDNKYNIKDDIEEIMRTAYAKPRQTPLEEDVSQLDPQTYYDTESYFARASAFLQQEKTSNLENKESSYTKILDIVQSKSQQTSPFQKPLIDNNQNTKLNNENNNTLNLHDSVAKKIRQKNNILESNDERTQLRKDNQIMKELLNSLIKENAELKKDNASLQTEVDLLREEVALSRQHQSSGL